MRDEQTWRRAVELAGEMPCSAEDVYHALMTGASDAEVRLAAQALRSGAVPRRAPLHPATLEDATRMLRAASDPPLSRWAQAAENALARAIERHG